MPKQEADRQKSLLEGAQRLRQRQARNPLEHARLPGQGKIQDPGADREGKGDDRRRCRAFGNAGRKQRDGAHQQAVEQVAESEIGGLQDIEVPAEGGPDHQGRDRGNQRGKPSAEDRRHLGGDQRRHTVWQLHQQAQCAGFLLASEAANGDERKQQGDDEVERTEGGDEHAVERREAGCKHRGIARGRTCFAIECHGLEETVADERAKDQQHGPERAAAHDVPQLLGQQRAQWSTVDHDCVR